MAFGAAADDMFSQYLESYVQSLVASSPPPVAKVRTLLRLCPRLGHVRPEERRTQLLINELKDVRKQSAILATQDFLLRSEGAMLGDILPMLISYMEVLKSCSAADGALYGDFPSRFLGKLGKISETMLPEKEQEQVTRDVFGLYEATMESNPALLSELLDAIGDGSFKFNDQQVKSLISGLTTTLQHLPEPAADAEKATKKSSKKRKKTSKKRAKKEAESGEDDAFQVRANVLRALERITHLDTVQRDPETLSQLYDIASKDSYQDLQFAVPLTIRCGLCDPSLASRLVAFLSAELLEPVPAFANSRDESRKFYDSVLTGLRDTALKYPNRAGGIMDVIIRFLVDILSQQSRDPDVRDCAVSRLVAIVEAQMKTRGIDSIRWVLDSLFNSLYTLYSNYTRVAADGKSERASSEGKARVEFQLVTVLKLLGRITCQLNNSEVTDMILPNLISRISYMTLDSFIIDQLTEIALLGQSSAYKQVVDLLTNIYRNCLNFKDNMQYSQTITNAFSKLASGLPRAQHREDLLLRLMELFNQIAILIHRKVQNRTGVLGLLPWLLPAIAELHQRVNTRNWDSAHVKSVWNVWFWCTIYREFFSTFADQEDLIKFAAKVPPLVAEKSTTVLELTLMLDSLIKQGLVFDDLAMRKQLSQTLANTKITSIFKEDLVKNLSAGECLYLQAVHYLETSRIHYGTVDSVFSYLEDQGVQSLLTIAPPIAEIADQVFLQYLDALKDAPETLAREEELTDLGQFLLVSFLHQQVSVRKAADKYILHMLEKFPQVLWSKKSLCTLLDLMEAVARGCDNQGHCTMRAKLPNSQLQVVLPEDYAGRKSMLGDITNLCTVWLKSALNGAPVETTGILEEYFMQFQGESRGFLHHVGFSLAVQLVSALNDSQRSKSDVTQSTSGDMTNFAIKQSSSNFINSLNLKATYRGEVQGMVSVMQQLGKGSDAAELAELFIAKLRAFVVDAEAGRVVDQNDLNGTLCKAAALLIAQDGFCPSLSDLLHLLCFVPVAVYTTKAIETGVFVWAWLLAARTDLNIRIMTEIKFSWSWMVDLGVGLFSQVERRSSPLSIPKQNASAAQEGTKAEKQNTDWADPKPHRLIIDFLYERFVLVRDRSPKQMIILKTMLMKAVARADRLSVAPDSLAIRFKLLLMCMHFIQGNYINDNQVKILFLERVYCAAIEWFKHPPVWYDPGSRLQVEADVKILVDFCVALEERRVLATNTLVPTMSNLPTGTDLASPGSLLFKVLDAMPPALSKDKTTSGTHKLASLGSSMLGVSISNLEPIVEYDGPKISPSRVRLLVVLIGHEIDRISAWHNPQHRLKKKFADESKFSAEKVIHGAQWRRLLRTAWDISPRVALMMGERFPFPKVRIFLEKETVLNASKLWDEPAAVSYLATPANVAVDLPELKHLLYWSTTTPPGALALLDNQFDSHSYVTQYALRVLRTFPAETIIFYIPQLVQTLRYDQSGLVENYLATAARTSQVLAHQVVWNAQTYVEDLEKSAAPPIAERANRLRNSIVSSFDSEAQKNYDNEFKFFETVTAIAGILKPYTKPERRQKLKEELKKIPIDGKLYLPTNPDTTVLAINPDKAAPMQSAEKVPILVTFLVSDKQALVDEVQAIEWTEADDLTLKKEKRRKRKKAKSQLRRDRSRKASAEPDLLDAVDQVKRKDKEKEAAKEQDSSQKENESEEKKDKKKKEKEEKQEEEEKPEKEQKDKIAANMSKFDAMSARAGTPQQSKKMSRSRSEKALPNNDTIDAAAHEDKQMQRNSANRRRASLDEQSHWQACIFKVGDDVRQDMLALQIIDLFKRIFESVDLPLFLYPYRVVATTPDEGIIECVVHARSRDQLGKQVEGSLYDYFQHRYGPVNSLAFQNARNNFLRSMAAYSVVSYILQIKDRHNGNMMIDDFGHIVHIDFGFIFDFSPGGNFKFERAPFKLSAEMLDLMGGDPNSEPFKWFMEYVTKAYLACRSHMDSITTLVSLMLDTQFPCFTDQSLTNLRMRFCAEKSEREAAKFMTYTVIEALGAFSSYTTLLYDIFQHWSNGIDY